MKRTALGRVLLLALGAWVLPMFALPVRGALVGQWTFDDVLHPYDDSSGYGSDGTAIGSPALGPAAVGSHALKLDGSSYLDVGSDPVFDTQTYSVSAWLNSNVLGSWRTAVGTWKGSGAHWMHFGLNNTSQFSNYVYIDGSQRTIVDTTTTVQTGKWYHVVSVVDKANKSLQLWVDGTKTANIPLTTWGTTEVPGTQTLNIGTPYAPGNNWTGLIDDVRIYDHALTETEIGQMIQEARQNPEHGLVSYWDFEGRTTDVSRQFRSHSGLAQDNLTAVDNVQFASGLVGQAAHLDGGYFTAAHSADVQLPDTFTIEAWINPDQVNVEWQRLVLNWGGTGKNAYHFAIHNGLVSLCINEADDHGFEVAVGGSLVPGQWQHVAAVLDSVSQTGKVYLNGIEVGSGVFDGTIFTSSDGLGIGDSFGIPSGGARYSGLLDELAIWNVALTPLQIAAHYEAGAAGYGLPVPEPSTLALLALGALGLLLPLGRRRK